MAAGLGCRPGAVRPVDTGPAGAVWVDRRIRVRLARGVEAIELAVEGGYRITDTAGKLLANSEGGLARCQARASRASQAVIWIGPRRFERETVQLIPTRDGTLQVDSRRYRGWLRLTCRPEGLTVVNIVDVEAYLKGVLRGELPPWFSRETFRAQAIAARTYALYQKFTVGLGRDYDVLATESSQVYIGVAGEDRKAVEAVDYTRGIVLTWSSPQGEKIFCSYYSSTCGGMTQDVANCKLQRSIPPLAGGVVCDDCWFSPYYTWPPVRLSKQFITERLRRRYSAMRQLGRVEQVQVLTRTSDGRPIWLRILDQSGRSFDLLAEDFRLCMGGHRLKSTHFRIEHEQEAILFTHGRGFGHGMGMCQYGAEGLARRGATAAQILRHYYPSSHLTRAYD
ncbi:MAG: SpoIID/LytB domain-containing protein [Phycisphaerae bacterium]